MSISTPFLLSWKTLGFYTNSVLHFFQMLVMPKFHIFMSITVKSQQDLLHNLYKYSQPTH